MIIGKGLVANTFTGSILEKNHLIFASGVSNSVNPLKKDFEREKSLLLSYKNLTKKIIYFSTCSIEDPSVIQKPYIQHKLGMEDLIANEFKEYLILRLPTMVGFTKNPNTFFNHFKTKILQGDELTIYKDAVRFLFDIDHLEASTRICTQLFSNQIINVAFNNKAFVLDIVKKMAELMEKDLKVHLMKKGANFSIKNEVFMQLVQSEPALNLLAVDYSSILNKYIND